MFAMRLFWGVNPGYPKFATNQFHKCKANLMASHNNHMTNQENQTDNYQSHKPIHFHSHCQCRNHPRLLYRDCCMCSNSSLRYCPDNLYLKIISHHILFSISNILPIYLSNSWMHRCVFILHGYICSLNVILNQSIEKQISVCNLQSQ